MNVACCEDGCRGIPNDNVPLFVSHLITYRVLREGQDNYFSRTLSQAVVRAGERERKHGRR